MAQFNTPASPATNIMAVERLRGIDLYNTPANVDLSRSPDAPNMIRGEVGNVRKRMGYEELKQYAAYFEDVTSMCDFCGDLIVQQNITNSILRYSVDEDGAINFVGGVWEGGSFARARYITIGGKLWIFNKTFYICYDGNGLGQRVIDIAYVPTIIISRLPTGGGVVYEPRNLLSNSWWESFVVDVEHDDYTEFQLTATNLASVIRVEVLGDDGIFHQLREGYDYVAITETGIIQFLEPPGRSPTGADNVRVWVEKYSTKYELIELCTAVAAYGVGGNPDRIFASGNPLEPGRDRYSAFQDPTYFGDTWYCDVGDSTTNVVGYAVVGDKLATFKDGVGDKQNVIVREGRLDTEETGRYNGGAVFPIINTVDGPGVVSPDAFATVGNETLFLTRRGVYAITAEELTGKQLTQLRSLYLTSVLENNPNANNAFAYAWGNYYMLSLGDDKLYLLDTLQREYSENAPNSAFQYECYMFTNIYSRAMWTDKYGRLYFTKKSADGEQKGLHRFYSDTGNPESYNDNGTAINAYWDTPDIDGGLFYKNKTFRRIYLRLASAIVTGVRVFAQKRGIWNEIYTSGEKARYFDWSYLNFEKFVFSSDRTTRTVGGKIKIKKVDKTRFRFQNDVKDEPFGLYAYAAEYTRPGSNYKG